MSKIKISCHVFDKHGNRVFNGFEKGYAIFESLSAFYDYMNIRYGFTFSDYDFVISGCYV